MGSLCCCEHGAYASTDAWGSKGLAHSSDLVPMPEHGWDWRAAQPRNVSLTLFRRGRAGPEVYLVRERSGRWGPPGGMMDHGEAVWEAALREYREETREGKQCYDPPPLRSLHKFCYRGHTAIIVGWVDGFAPEGPPPPNPHARSQEILDRRWVSTAALRSGDVQLRNVAQGSMAALLQVLNL
mmetsp:Transcript_11911/g.23114  ORF Transcript_11911/g.23114 Transcript_11911/m.23114 type:complete len:183 (-) Transcript_11911:213-761(-)